MVVDLFPVNLMYAYCFICPTSCSIGMALLGDFAMFSD